MKLRNKLLTYIGLPVVVILILFTFLAYTFSDKMLLQSNKTSMYNLVSKYGSDIETDIGTASAKIENIANSIEGSNVNDAHALQIVTKITQLNPIFNKIYIGLPNKKFIDGTGWVPPADYDPTSRSWYKASSADSKLQISQPYVAKSTGKNTVTLSKDIKRNGTLYGVVGGDLSMDNISKKVNEIKVGKNGKVYLLTSTGNYIADQKYTLDDKIETVDKDLSSKILTGKEENFEYKNMMYSTYLVKGTDWTLVSYIPKSEVVADSVKLGTYLLILGLVSLLVLAAIIYYISKSITYPIERLCTCIGNMANYDLTLTPQTPSVIYSDRTDEIGDISKALVQVKKNMQDIMISMNDIASQVSASSEQLTATAEQSAMTAQDVSNAMEEISKGAMSQAEDMERGTFAMENMKESLDSTEKSINLLSSMSQKVLEAKEKGLKAVEELILATKESQEKSALVNEVIINTNDSAMQIATASDMIKSIADQTNLLALNAAIDIAVVM